MRLPELFPKPLSSQGSSFKDMELYAVIQGDASLDPQASHNGQFLGRFRTVGRSLAHSILKYCDNIWLP
ncbi:hypothetical protein TNCV_1862581 [Trichonephila clavipes]|nr:hypothetical protein TNCV_1862581 [Trichonephila clavipes]